MAITRTPMIDDDGSGTTGTIINNAWKQEFYDQIDVVANPKSITTSDTGTINDWNPTGFTGRTTAIYWTGATTTTLGGLVGGLADGQIVTIKNRTGTGAILNIVAHDASASLAANRFVTMLATHVTPVGPEGFVTFVWIATWGKWYLIGHNQGVWITPAFSAADWTTTGGGTWTVAVSNVNVCAYWLQGRTLHWSIEIFNSTVAGAANTSLNCAIPGAFTAQNRFPAWAYITIGATTLPCLGLHVGTNVQIYQNVNAPAFPAGQCYLQAMGCLQVQ